MKNLNVQKLGLEELNKAEQVKTNGGILPGLALVSGIMLVLRGIDAAYQYSKKK